MHNRMGYRSVVLAMILVVATTEIAAQEDSDFVQRALDDSTFVWGSSASNGVRIYYQRGSFAERHRMMILRSVTASLDEVLELLGEPEYDTSLNVFYVDSREEMKRIVGRPYSGFSNWSANGVFVVLNPEWRSFETHEIAHVVSMGVWGPPDVTTRWMTEGIAIYCDGWCREYTVDEIAFHLLSNGELPPLQEFFDDFASLGEIRAGLYAASVVGFIRITYGADALRRLWSNGVGDLKALLGDDANQIESSWKDYLQRTVRKDVQVDLDTINKLGCG